MHLHHVLTVHANRLLLLVVGRCGAACLPPSPILLPFPCRRYQLPAEPPPRSAAAAAALATIDTQEPDAELRADLMANALLMPLLGRHAPE